MPTTAAASFASTSRRARWAAPAVLSPPPFVSCIMPTANRRRFVPAAIAQFLAQDYPARELIVLDDGEDAVDDLVPDHPAVRYVRRAAPPQPGRQAQRRLRAAPAPTSSRTGTTTTGTRRTASAPRSMRSRAAGRRSAGIDKVLFYDPSAPSAWEYAYPPGGAPWVYGATLCYRRDFWRAHPFADVTVGEDNVFAGAARPSEICVMPDNRFFVGRVHSANTSAKQVRDPRWRPHDVAAVRALVGDAWPRS